MSLPFRAAPPVMLGYVPFVCVATRGYCYLDVFGHFQRAKRAAELASHVFDATLAKDLSLAVEVYFDQQKRRNLVRAHR